MFLPLLIIAFTLLYIALQSTECKGAKPAGSGRARRASHIIAPRTFRLLTTALSCSRGERSRIRRPPPLSTFHPLLSAQLPPLPLAAASNTQCNKRPKYEGRRFSRPSNRFRLLFPIRFHPKKASRHAQWRRDPLRHEPNGRNSRRGSGTLECRFVAAVTSSACRLWRPAASLFFR